MTLVSVKIQAMYHLKDTEEEATVSCKWSTITASHSNKGLGVAANSLRGILGKFV